MAVTLTAAAAKAVAQVMTDQDMDQTTHYIRVGCKGGGCSGMSYTMDVVGEKDETDEEWESDGIKVLCDGRSLIYLNGTEIDFKDELMQKGFVFKNPSAQTSCGCGSSFDPG